MNELKKYGCWRDARTDPPNNDRAVFVHFSDFRMDNSVFPWARYLDENNAQGTEFASNKWVYRNDSGGYVECKPLFWMDVPPAPEVRK